MALSISPPQVGCHTLAVVTHRELSRNHVSYVYEVDGESVSTLIRNQQLGLRRIVFILVNNGFG